MALFHGKKDTGGDKEFATSWTFPARSHMGHDRFLRHETLQLDELNRPKAHPSPRMLEVRADKVDCTGRCHDGILHAFAIDGLVRPCEEVALRAATFPSPLTVVPTCPAPRSGSSFGSSAIKSVAKHGLVTVSEVCTPLSLVRLQ